MSDRPHLRSLADRLGILPDYVDIQGELRVTKDATRAALLNALGFDVSDEPAAARAIDRRDRDARDRILPPVRVVVIDQIRPVSVLLNLPGTDELPVDWWLELIQESGTRNVVSGRSVPRQPDHSIEVVLPVHPPIGYHTVHIRLGLSGDLLEAEQLLIVSPGRCFTLEDRLGDRRPFGIWCNLYSLKSERNWGVGDFTDLQDLARSLASCGAAFIGVNPLHALRNRGEGISPYSPVSRLFRNPIYLDIEAIPEFADCPKVKALTRSVTFRADLKQVRAAKHVEYERIAALKMESLRLLHDVFQTRNRHTPSDRGMAYDKYICEHGQPLIDFATFLAIEECGTIEAATREQAEAFRADHPQEIDFHCYVQFELDCQLAQVADEMRLADMPIGLYQDLAIGSAPDGADTAIFPNLFVPGVEVGAPPDPYSDVGQKWGIPPINPVALQAGKYAYWIALLRHVLAHTGMLRIDHVMGLFRQFWVPRDEPATEGAYTVYPADDLLGILAVESHRHGTVVVGEDLGTVPPNVPLAMAKWGILSSRVMQFEKDHAGDFKEAAAYDANALVTATTHDHPPLGGFWSGRDLDIRREIGLFESDEQLDEARVERRQTRQALVHRLVAEGQLATDTEPAYGALVAAVHPFLTRTPAAILGLSLDDLAGETDPVNIPGVTPSQYPCWSRRMQRTIDDILADPGIRDILADVRERLE